MPHQNAFFLMKSGWKCYRMSYLLETNTMTEMIRRLTALCLLAAFVGCSAESDGDFSSPEDQDKMKRRDVGKTRAAPGSQLGAPKESDGQ